MSAHCNYIKETLPTVIDGINVVKSNHSQSYCGMVVRTKCGCEVELRGVNDPKDGLKFQVCIPKYDGNGKVCKYRWNETAEQDYTIEYHVDHNWACIEYSDMKDSSIKFRNEESFIKYIENRDFKTKPIRMDQVVLYYEPVYGYKTINF